MIRFALRLLSALAALLCARCGPPESCPHRKVSRSSTFADALRRGLVPLVLVALVGCTPAQRLAWGRVGVAELGCLAPALQGVVATALQSLVSLAAGGQVGWREVGLSLAAQYGAPLALCAVQRGWEAWGGMQLLPASGPPGAPHPRAREAVRWLRAHPDDWLPRGR